jgi:serine protease DegQ
MRRRAFLTRLLSLGLASVTAFLLGLPPSPGLPAEATCPQCGAALEPGAAFCGRCGRKLERPVAPEPSGAFDRRRAVVQVVTAHDKELTSTFGSLAYESNLRVDSILGSAFAVAPGEFVTDSGLLVGAKEVSLRDTSGRSFPAKVLGSDSMIGVALLKADLPEITVLSLREVEAPRTGESLTALGFPSDTRASREPVLSAGVVSGLHRGPAGIHPIEDYLQTDASLPLGLAGGPMIDSRGRVVGMSTGRVLGEDAYLGPQSGIGFAVPVEWIARALAWIRSGAPARAWIGAYAIAADSETRAKHRLPPQVRLLIDQVFPGSPAALAGLRRGDGLLKIQGEEISILPRLQERLLGAKPGEKVTLQITRAGENLSFDVPLALRPDKPRLTGIDALRFFGGLEIAPKEDDRLVVATVTPGSYVAGLKISQGDVLQSILSKKDWMHGAKDNSRWRSVRTVADLESRVETAYSDFDFCLGLRFRSKDGTRRELLVCEILSPTAAL